MFRRIVISVTAGVAICAVLGLVGGCLTRPVAAREPITNTNFITSIATSTIDKVDILFDIDNSASMGDKEAYLAKAIPDLLTRLVQPNCVDPNGNITGPASLSSICTDPASQPEFPPVHNMHIGIVSSSLGGRLGDACPTTGPESTQKIAGGAPISRHNDDQGHLLNRTADPATQFTNYTEGTLADAPDPDDFLNWFPPPTVNGSNGTSTSTGPQPISTSSGTGSALNSDFQQLVVGVHEFGCGIESQLESWYRFLIQPDPYASLSKDSTGKFAQWVGVDTTILQQRADFLRPDSLVAVLVLTDENDSEVDVRSFGGTAWNFMTSLIAPAPFYPPRGTQICQTKPNDSACTSCAFPGHGNDPGCMTNGGKYTANTDWGADLNLRHVHEKQKYGVSVQFPIQRYVLGLTSPRVPNRDSEYPAGADSYQGLLTSNLTCTNPLYAASLPRPPATGTWAPSPDELCSLPPGTRNPKLVFYAHIGGVPHQLLQVDPTDPNSNQKLTLSADDWKLILGNDAETYDYTGIDPHMVESYNQRTMVPVPPANGAMHGGFPVSDQTQPEGSDPISGREWQTDSTSPMHQGLRVDREYACIFKLDKPRDCSDAAIAADPTLQDSCDCQAPQGGGQFTHAEVPAVCNDATPTTQEYAKAYPTIRELELAHLLGQVPGANEGIISSLCPIHTADNATHTDPLYGYRPAMNAIVHALSSVLSSTCLPTRLTIDKSDPAHPTVPCLVLGTFPAPPGMNNVPTGCAAVQGGAYQDADSTVLQEFKTDQHAQWERTGSVGTDPSLNLTCEVVQQPPNSACKTDTKENGWCYVENNATSTGCAQAIFFSKTALTSGVVMSLQCLEASPSVLDDGGAAATPVALPVSDAATGGG